MDGTQDKLYKTEDGSALRFWWATERNNYQSETHNVPVYDEVLFVEIFAPGSRESSPVYEVRRRFAELTGLAELTNAQVYARYRSQVDAFVSNETNFDLAGTPLSQWTALDRGQVAALNEQRIFTVDALAVLPDEKLRVLGMEGRSLRERAKAYLDEAANGSATAGLVTRIADMEAENALLRKRVEVAEKELAGASVKATEKKKPAPFPEKDEDII